MVHLHKLGTLIAAACLMLVGCASSPQASSGSSRAGSDCFFAAGLRDWRPLDNSNLILFGAGRVPYHVTLVRPAFGLNFDIMIGVYDRDGRICPFGGDAIIIDGFMPERIAIRSIRRLTDDQLAAVYADFGITPPAVVTTTEIPVEDGAGSEGEDGEDPAPQ